MKVTLLSTLSTEKLGKHSWVLVRDLCIDVDGNVYCVPVGFRSDGVTGTWYIDEGSVIHDWLYRTKLVSRLKADAILFYVSRSVGVGVFRSSCRWALVRLFGWIFYNKG